jgi:hypothetical protein
VVPTVRKSVSVNVEKERHTNHITNTINQKGTIVDKEDKYL